MPGPSRGGANARRDLADQSHDHAGGDHHRSLPPGHSPVVNALHDLRSSRSGDQDASRWAAPGFTAVMAGRPSATADAIHWGSDFARAFAHARRVERASSPARPAVNTDGTGRDSGISGAFLAPLWSEVGLLDPNQAQGRRLRNRRSQVRILSGALRTSRQSACKTACCCRRSAPLVCDEVGHGLGGFEPCSPSARTTRRGRFANQAAGAQISQGVDLVDGNQARDATATHRHDDLGAVLDVLDVAAEAVVQLADAHFSLQRFGMWRHSGRLYALHRPLSRIARSNALLGRSESPCDRVADAPNSPEAGSSFGRHPGTRRGDRIALPPLAFAQVRAPECRSAARLLRTTSSRPDRRRTCARCR